MSTAVLVTFVFATIWFNPNNFTKNFDGTWHFLDVLLFLLVTYVIWHPIFMKFTAYVIMSHIQTRDVHAKSPAPGSKVAFITTFVPSSESIELLHKTLPAMVSAEYPHDTWILDEGNDPAVRALCEEYGVNHFSRHEIEYYNQEDGKFARRTKGGNHNSWYDGPGKNYDFVAQIDTDFIPRKDFLSKTLGYFRDPKIGFVGTPQIYGNVKDSAIAHGAAQQTYNFYGPLLRGMSGMESSMLIGANHIIRVKALESVDHYSAHITEDLLTGMKLHANGWKSIYYPEALAIGEGPITWKSYFTQQKRWAYGCMHILFNHSLKLITKMKFRQALYYYCIQQHYFSGLAMFLGVIGLAIYFYFGLTAVNIDFSLFISAYISIVILFSVFDLWFQKFNARPDVERGIMWYGMFIGIAVWPVYFQAFYSLFKRKKLKYKVTPKGRKSVSRDVPVALFIPHFVLGSVALSGVFVSMFTDRDSVIMLFWSIVCGVGLIGVPLVPIIYSKVYKFKKRHSVKTDAVLPTVKQT
ncbi:MAG: glycosyltransferase family 2 protein [Candidatus Microsaccharimonas sp.]